MNLKVVSIFAIVSTIAAESTPYVGFQVAADRCRLGTVYQPTTCTKCVCGLFKIMVCRQSCFSDEEEDTPITPRPSGVRQSGPTIIPIRLPIFGRRTTTPKPTPRPRA